MIYIRRSAQFVFSIYVMIIFLLLLIIAYPLAHLFKHLKEPLRSQTVYRSMRTYAYIWCWSCGIFPKNYFRKRVDWNKKYIVIANHQSYFDPVNMYCALHKPFKALGKVEIEKVPLFGRVYKLAVITIDRNNIKDRIRSFRQMHREMSHGISILIFPEGTFPDNKQREMLSFEEGAFSLAQLTKKDVLPVLFLDPATRMAPNSVTRFSPGRLRTVFLKPIPYEKIKGRDPKTVSEYCRNYMQAYHDHILQHGVKNVRNYDPAPEMEVLN